MITLKNVTKEYQLDAQTSVVPVRDVSLEVEQGEFLMIVGRSGAGKTTLLNLSAGLVKPTSGQVLIDGKDIQTLDEKALSELRSKKIGFVFQAASMLPSLSVIENVAVPAMFGGEGGTEQNFERAAEVLQMVGLESRMHALPKQLSGGETRRVAIARALMNKPEILIADEPTSDLDVQTEMKIVATLQKIHETGVTVMMVTHSMELIPYASRALRMENGTLLPLEEGALQPQALHLESETSAASPSLLTRPQRTLSRWSSWLGKPAHAVYVAMGVALVVLLVVFGIAMSKIGDDTANTQSASNPGPVLPGTTGMNGMSGGTGTYDPSTYNLYGNTGLYTQASMGVSWPLKIDPPPGDPFKDLPVLENESGTPGVFQATLEAKKTEIDLGGTKANLMTYNGSYPGPLITVKRGDTMKIHFVNSLPATTEKNVLGYEKNHSNLHTHGLHVSTVAPSDDVMLDIAPGGTYDYQYDLSKQPGGTLNFLHPHVHGLVAEQLYGGLLTPLVVEDEVPALSAYESHVMVLKDITIAGNEPQAHLFMSDYMYGKEGNIVTVNGQVNPVLDIKPGQVQRWRFLNGSNARFYRVYLENHVLYLVGTDGGLLDKPYPVSSLLLAPGERADVLVQATTTTASYKLVSLPYSRIMGCGGMDSGLMGMSMTGQTTNPGSGTYYPGMNMMGMNMMGTNVAGATGTGMNGTGMMGMNGTSILGAGMMGTGMTGTGMTGTGMYGTGMNGTGMNGYVNLQYPTVYAYWPAITNLLGLSTAEILTKFTDGSSLADMAEAKGVTQDQVVETILTQVKIYLNQSASSGYITQDQVAQQLTVLEPVIKQAVSTKGSVLPQGMNSMSGTYNPFMYDPLLYSGLNAGSGNSSSSGMGGMNTMGPSGMCPGMIGTIGMSMYDMSAAAQVTLLTMTCKGGAVTDALPEVVDAEAKRLSMDLTNLPKRTITFGMDMGNAYINGMDFDVQPFTIKSELGTYEVWQLVNPTCMDHPFHAHVSPFQVLSVMGGDADYARTMVTTPALKDVVIVPKMGTVTILMPVEDFEGMAMFHCHILEHEDIGMMGLWQRGAAQTMPAGTTPATTQTTMPTGM